MNHSIGSFFVSLLAIAGVAGSVGAGCTFARVESATPSDATAHSAGPNSHGEPSQGPSSNGDSPAEPNAGARLGSFGVREARGEAGLGTLRNTLETVREVAIAGGRRLEVQSDVTLLLLAAEQLRSVSTRSTHREENGKVSYRGRSHPRISVEIDIDGDRVRVRTDGVLPAQLAQTLPERMPHARVLDEDRLPALEDLFVQRLRSFENRPPTEAWDAWDFDAIVPSLLAIRSFRVDVVGSEELQLPERTVSTLHVRLTRRGNPASEQARELPGSPDFVRDLWLTPRAQLVKMEIRPQGAVHQAHTLGYSHEFYPGFAGFKTSLGLGRGDAGATGDLVVATPASFSAASSSAPVVIVVVGDSIEERRIANRLLWQLPARGLGVVQVPVTPANLAARTREVHEGLRSQGQLDMTRVDVVAIGRTAAVACVVLPESAGWTKFSRGLLLINGVAESESGLSALRAAIAERPAPYRVAVLLGRGGDSSDAESRRTFAELFVGKATNPNATAVRVLEFPDLDARLCKTPTDGEPLDPDPIAAGVIDALAAWFGVQEEKRP